MGSWYESRIDREIREAQERGEFDNLPGTGKPLPGAGEHYSEDWWLKDLIRRENLGGLAPTSLQIRKAAEEVMAAVAKRSSEQSVRQLVTDLNERIDKVNRGLVDGPAAVIQPLDADEIVERWRALKGLR
ncbi:MAG: DUF1992 domain-containing protein [Hamadaea sp.]|nr:DUF1992 domain-containing protein [Hamadaea sp.]